LADSVGWFWSKIMEKLVLSLLLFCLIFIKNVYGQDELLKFHVSGGYITKSIEYSGTNEDFNRNLIINTDPLYTASLGIELLPDSFGLKLSYGATLNEKELLGYSATESQRNEADNAAEFYNISKSFGSEDLGYILLGYFKHSYNSTIRNVSDSDVVLDDVETDGQNPKGYENHDAVVLAPGEEFTVASETETYNITFVTTFYLGFGYSRDKRVEPVLLGKTNNEIQSETIRRRFDGDSTSVGLFAPEERDDGFDFNRLLYYQRDYSETIDSVYGEEYFDSVHSEGYILEFSYKIKLDSSTFFMNAYLDIQFRNEGDESEGNGSLQTTQLFAIDIGYIF
jgi:hypothetical protein